MPGSRSYLFSLELPKGQRALWAPQSWWERHPLGFSSAKAGGPDQGYYLLASEHFVALVTQGSTGQAPVTKPERALYVTLGLDISCWESG